MNALRRIHAVLVPGGLVLDTQPISARPPVTAADGVLGTLDMRAWGTTIEAVYRLVGATIDEGLFVLDAEHRFVVTDSFDEGREFVDAVRGWQGTRVSRALSRRAAVSPPPIRVDQEVRLRVLRALPTVGRAPAAERSARSTSPSTSSPGRVHAGSWRVGAVDVARAVRPLHDPRHR